MSLLLDLSLRGTMVLLVLLVFDRLFGAGMLAARRRWWWYLALVPFLLPVRVAVFLSPEIAEKLQNLPVHLLAATPDVANAATITQSANMNLWPWIWFSGFVIHLTLVAGRSCRAMRQWSREKESDDRGMLALLEECKRALGITIHFGLVVSPRVLTPTLQGWFRPRILLPARLVSSMHRDQVRAVLLHELAHCRTCDVLVSYLFSLVCAVHWFNPLVHFGYARWRAFQEVAADETAVRCLGEFPPRTYCDILLQTLRHTNEETLVVGALGMGASFRDLKKRITSIWGFGGKSSQSILAAAVALLLASLVFLQPAGRATAFTEAVNCPVSCVLARHIYVCHLPSRGNFP